MNTARCVICMAPAGKIACGHMKHFQRTVMASFCSDTCMRARNPPGGHFGEWTPDMGIVGFGNRATANACNCGPKCVIWRFDRRWPES